MFFILDKKQNLNRMNNAVIDINLFYRDRKLSNLRPDISQKKIRDFRQGRLGILNSPSNRNPEESISVLIVMSTLQLKDTFWGQVPLHRYFYLLDHKNIDGLYWHKPFYWLHSLVFQLVFLCICFSWYCLACL